MHSTLRILLFTLPLLGPAAFAADALRCAPQEYGMGLRYQQQSAEIMALQLQTYRLATARFLQKVNNMPSPEKAAVVLDLDETVIDNTPLLVRDLQNCHDYTRWDTWGDWEKRGRPALIPGAKAFLEEVDRHRVAIYYVSDRTQANKKATLATLKALGLPQVSDQSVLLDTAAKEARRRSIQKTHHIIMLFGDSLPDFAAQYKKPKAPQAQRQQVESDAAHFGDDWIVLPNAAYGAWTKAPLSGWKQHN